MKDKTLLVISLVINALFIIFILLFLFTPYLDSIIMNKKGSDSFEKLELALQRDESCNKAEHLRWNGILEAKIEIHGLGNSIEEDLEYYQKNLELLNTGFDEQGNKLTDSEKEVLIEEFKSVQKEAETIYAEYLQEKNACKELAEEYLSKYGEE